MTLRLMRPSAITTGVKFNPTPNFFHWIEYWQLPTVPAVDAVQVYPAGIGNSPPAWKLALSPEIAVRFGSASVLITPARSMARRLALTLFQVAVMAFDCTSACP